jgi:NAD(P)-dependent dehydrogenase (short-subunit alcohol dehydrogenase family)
MSVIVVTGSGGMGLACARRIGSGHQLVLAEANAERLDAAVGALGEEGFDVLGYQIDVSDRASVEGLVTFTADQGRLSALVHTAGLSPSMASGNRILEVNLGGTSQLIESFEGLATEGTVGVFIASMAGHLWPMSDEMERAIATASVDSVVAATGLGPDVDSSEAYAVSKRGVILRVVAAARPWGVRGARIVSLSPGMVATPMGHQESAAQPFMSQMLADSPVPRMGTAADIAGMVAWLVGPEASFVTGSDFLVDGGVVAALRGWS